MNRRVSRHLAGAALAALLILPFSLFAGGVTAPAAHAQATPALTGFCGTVASFTAAGTTAGSISFSGVSTNQMFPIAAGVTLTNQANITAGANICLTFTLDTLGNITAGTVLPNTPVSLVVCGPVTSYTAATTSAPGTLVIGGITFTTAPGTTFNGGPPVVGTSSTFTLTLNGLAVVSTGTISAATCAAGTTTVSGATNFTQATSAAAGFIVVNGFQIPIAAGSTINFVTLAAYLPGGGGGRVLEYMA